MFFGSTCFVLFLFFAFSFSDLTNFVILTIIWEQKYDIDITMIFHSSLVFQKQMHSFFRQNNEDCELISFDFPPKILVLSTFEIIICFTQLWTVRDEELVETDEHKF